VYKRQAFFFGDGGISTLGANCLNMGVVGVGCAYLVYRAIAANAAIDSPRRVAAAAVAGYVAINVAALATALEFGVQPLWFHSEAGVPLYAPYPLAIAVPAMMVGHLGIAGFAEAAVSGGLLSWLQRTEPELLRATAGLGADEPAPGSAWRPVRRLLMVLGVLMIVAPLGQLAAGTAWGEWGAEDFADEQKRAEIVAASLGGELPAAMPTGLARLATLWQAPLPDYEIPFLPGSVGYAFAAMLGGGLTLLASLAAGWSLARLRRRSARE
jgi:cobalt/nickel transport system permease protein